MRAWVVIGVGVLLVAGVIGGAFADSQSPSELSQRSRDEKEIGLRAWTELLSEEHRSEIDLIRDEAFMAEVRAAYRLGDRPDDGSVPMHEALSTFDDAFMEIWQAWRDQRDDWEIEIGYQLEASRWAIERGQESGLETLLQHVLEQPGFVRRPVFRHMYAQDMRSLDDTRTLGMAVALYLRSHMQVAMHESDLERVFSTLDAAEHIGRIYEAQPDFHSRSVAFRLLGQGLNLTLEVLRDERVDLAVKQKLAEWLAAQGENNFLTTRWADRAELRMHVLAASVHFGHRLRDGNAARVLGDRLGAGVYDERMRRFDMPAYACVVDLWPSLTEDDFVALAGDAPERTNAKNWERLARETHAVWADWAKTTGVLNTIGPLVAKDCQRTSLSLLLAIEEYALERGELPASLDDVARAAGVTVPVDPFDPDGGPLRYRVLDEPDERGRRYLLYSVGTDGDDDEGTPKMQAWSLEGVVDGDAIVN
ncbi:MAG: hypothetical protein AAGG07_05175 [Planctomycetota bacterium]